MVVYAVVDASLLPLDGSCDPLSGEGFANSISVTLISPDTDDLLNNDACVESLDATLLDDPVASFEKALPCVEAAPVVLL